MNRGYPNGGTHLGNTQVPQAESIGLTGGTEGTETSKYLQEKKSIEIPPVAASERGLAQTETTMVVSGLWGPDMGLMMGS